MRMFGADFGQQSFGGIALTIVFAAAILLLDRLRRQGEDFAMVGVQQDRAQHLMLVAERARLLVDLLLAAGAVDLLRGKVARAVERQQVGALVENIIFE